MASTFPARVKTENRTENRTDLKNDKKPLILIIQFCFLFSPTGDVDAIKITIGKRVEETQHGNTPAREGNTKSVNHAFSQGKRRLQAWKSTMADWHVHVNAETTDNVTSTN